MLTAPDSLQGSLYRQTLYLMQPCRLCAEPWWHLYFSFCKLITRLPNCKENLSRQWVAISAWERCWIQPTLMHEDRTRPFKRSVHSCDAASPCVFLARIESSLLWTSSSDIFRRGGIVRVCVKGDIQLRNVSPEVMGLISMVVVMHAEEASLTFTQAICWSRLKSQDLVFVSCQLDQDDTCCPQSLTTGPNPVGRDLLGAWVRMAELGG